MAVNNCHQILGSSLSPPTTRDGKTLILFDVLVSNTNDGITPYAYEFMLYKHDNDGNIVKVGYKCIWFIVNNSYLLWSCIVPPVIRFSE